MTNRQIVVGVSFGTSVLLVALTALVCTAILTQPMVEPAPVVQPPRLGPPISAVKQAFDELKYGPVNKAAQNEIKDGLFARVRAARQARVSQQVHTYSQPVPNSAPQSVTIVCPPKVERTDCNYAYVQTTPQVAPPVVFTATPAPAPVLVPEYPAAPSPPPVVDNRNIDDLLGPKPCMNCRDPKHEAKTGSFVCSHCRKPCVGDDWFTYWQDDGTPVTFLCRSCNARLTPNAKEAVYQRYLQRQSLKTLGAFQPEVE